MGAERKIEKATGDGEKRFLKKEVSVAKKFRGYIALKYD